MTEKACGTCKQTLPLGAFGVDASRKGGYKSTCKECWRLGRNKRPPKIEGQHRCSRCQEYKPKTTEFFCITRGGTCHNYCRACESARKKEWWAGLSLEERQARCSKDPAYAKAIKQRHWLKLRADPERLARHRAQGRRGWAVAYSRDPMKFIIRGQQDRARRVGVPGNFTKADLAEKFREQGGLCLYCGVSVRRKWTVEHITPISRGGTNGPENIAIACPTCNFSKRDKLPHEWMPERFSPPIASAAT